MKRRRPRAEQELLPEWVWAALFGDERGLEWERAKGWLVEHGNSVLDALRWEHAHRGGQALGWGDADVCPCPIHAGGQAED